MIDKTPYIIVDNRKIAPIERSPRPDSATDGPKDREGQTFGVVDRVTISSEAREKSMQPPVETGPPALHGPSKKIANHPTRLTYSPKQWR